MTTLSRRGLLLRSLASMGTGLVLACAQMPVASVTPQPTPLDRRRTELPELTGHATNGVVADVPRERTLILIWAGQNGTYVDQESWNPYAIGASHQNGSGIFYEPLAFYSAFADREILWLAESYEYNADWTQLTIRLRSGATWSDGVAFDSSDVAFTLNTLRDLGPAVVWGKDIQDAMTSAMAVDPRTVAIQLTAPMPRFFDLLTYAFDIGVYIVPKHVFEGQDWTSFRAYDPSRGWPITTGPWRLTASTAEQKVIDRRSEWWAVAAGLCALPAVERIVLRPYIQERQLAEQLVVDQVDSSWGLDMVSIPSVLHNPKVVTHTWRTPPYGFVDWWPTGLYLNTSRQPFDDPKVRWALSTFIDRDEIIREGLKAGDMSALPMPPYPALQPYADAISDLLKTYPTNEFNPAKGTSMLQNRGWSRNPSGTWLDRQGNTFTLDIAGSNGQIGSVVERQLRRQGIVATYREPPDAGDAFYRGDYWAHIEGHGGAVRDPYYTLRLYDSRRINIPGMHQVNFTRWSNPAFDAILDRMAMTPPSETDSVRGLFRSAMEIWLRELPDIQLTQTYQRVPMNMTYWHGWPNQDNNYVDGAFWHLTFPLILRELQYAEPNSA